MVYTAASLAQQCNGGGVQVVSLLSAGGGGDVERLAVHDHQALVGLEGKGRGNLDGLLRLWYYLAVNICFTLRPSSYELGGLVFFTGPLTPVSPRCEAESKTGAALGKSQEQRPF